MEPGKEQGTFVMTLADANVITVRMDSNGYAIDPDNSSLDLSPKVTKAIEELKRVANDPKMQYRGRLSKTKITQNRILAPHFTKTRGNLRTDSPLKQFTPEQLGFDADFWKYLKANVAHHAEVQDPNAKVDGSSRAYKRKQNQERTGGGRFGSKISPLKSNGVFDPSTPGLHPLNAKYAVLHALWEGNLQAKHLGLKRFDRK